MVGYDASETHPHARTPFQKILINETWYKTLLWGITENSSIFVLSLLLPALLAIKYRHSHGVSMAGTVLGVTIALTNVGSQCMVSIITPFLKDF